MNGLKPPGDLSDGAIESFFANHDAWKGKVHILIEKDARTQAISSNDQGQDPRWYESRLKLAADSSCAICGTHPCGEATTKAMVTIIPSQKLENVWGICSTCAPSTKSQSYLRIYYRAWYALFNQKLVYKEIISVGQWGVGSISNTQVVP